MKHSSDNKPISELLSAPPYADLGPDEGLRPIAPAGGGQLTASEWEVLREQLRSQWDRVLGHADLAPFDRTPQVLRRFSLPECDATEVQLPTTATSSQKILVMAPKGKAGGPLPGAVIPFYNPDLMAGYDLETGEPKDAPAVHFGRHLVQLGFLVVCGQAFPFNTVEDPGTGASFAQWHAAVDKLHGQYPQWTGMARLVHDTRVALDFLLDQPQIDPERVLVMGHSLGGKMAFYTGCLDARIKAIIASDFGIPFSSTNWDAPWYLGPQIHEPDFPVAHHHLLALAAPTPFLILAGDCDGPRSWQYLNAARSAYQFHGRDDALAILDHATGHRPPGDAVRTAYEWLGEQFDLTLGDCRI
ncbi:MAG: prolyl oligopeptidase family serine peptidase [Victivallales bacterium]|jgi:dienelactone hydrolase|nr:prolyl oligopeptidase family serine peptidase [Victivallales bacterium]